MWHHRVWDWWALHCCESMHTSMKFVNKIDSKKPSLWEHIRNLPGLEHQRQITRTLLLFSCQWFVISSLLLPWRKSGYETNSTSLPHWLDTKVWAIFSFIVRPLEPFSLRRDCKMGGYQGWEDISVGSLLLKFTLNFKVQTDNIYSHRYARHTYYSIS